MKEYERLNPFKVKKDELTQFLQAHDFQISIFTHWPQQPNKTICNIFTPYIKILFIESGESSLIIKDNEYLLKANDIAIIPPFTLHAGKTSQAINSYEIFFNITPISHEQYFLQCLQLDKIKVFKNIMNLELKTFLQKTYEESSAHSEGSYLQIEYLLKLLFIKYFKIDNTITLPLVQTSREQQLIDDLFQYLNIDISISASIPKICDALHISQSYLYKCTKSILNCSPIESIVRFKMTKAQQLLKERELTINDISQQLGYNSVYYFSTQFKKYHAVSPNKWRKIHSN